MRYTHGYSFICRVLNIICNLAVLGLVADALMLAGVPKGYAIIIGFVAMIAFHFGFLGHLFNYLSSYLYIRLSLRTPITFSEAKYFAFLFVPNDTGSWWPMREIKNLPKESRRQYIFEFAERVHGSLDSQESSSQLKKR